MGSGYPLQINENMTNPFWKEILQHWKEFCDLVSVETVCQILNSPLWYNKTLTQGINYFIKNWYEKGIRLVSDLLDQNGIFFYNFETFKTTYGVAGTFLDYQIRKESNDQESIQLSHTSHQRHQRKRNTTTK